MVKTLAETVLLLGGAGIGALLAWLLSRRIETGVVALLAVFVADAIAVGLPGFRVGVLVYPQDILFVLLLVAGVARLTRGVSVLQVVLLLYGALIMRSFIAGAQTFGMQAAGVDARPFFYFIAGAFYFSTFSIGLWSQRSVSRWLAVAASAMVGLGVFRWVATALGLPIVSQWKSITTSPMRVLHAGHALFLSQCALIVFVVHLERKGRGRLLSAPLFAAVLLLQHRTIWVEMLVIAALGLFAAGRLRKRLVSQAAGIGLAAAMFTLAMFGSRIDSVGASLSESASNQDSFVWRLTGWKLLLDGLLRSDLTTKLLGAPFGAGYERTVRMVRVVANPHNFYLQTTLRLGVVGLIALVTIYALLLYHCGRTRAGGDNWLRPGLVQLVVLTQLLYFVTYPPGFEQALLLGLALGYVRAQRGDGSASVTRYSPPRQQHGFTARRPDQRPDYVPQPPRAHPRVPRRAGGPMPRSRR